VLHRGRAILIDIATRWCVASAIAVERAEQSAGPDTSPTPRNMLAVPSSSTGNIEMCCLGWQESLAQFAALVEPEIPDRVLSDPAPGAMP
jgi:hypothetical protein